jgi:hypothetical protein
MMRERRRVPPVARGVRILPPSIAIPLHPLTGIAIDRGKIRTPGYPARPHESASMFCHLSFSLHAARGNAEQIAKCVNLLCESPAEIE